MTLWRPVYQRASLIAFSFASAPPLVKKDISRSPGVISASMRASVERGSVAVGYRDRLERVLYRPGVQDEALRVLDDLAAELRVGLDDRHDGSLPRPCYAVARSRAAMIAFPSSASDGRRTRSQYGSGIGSQ